MGLFSLFGFPSPWLVSLWIYLGFVTFWVLFLECYTSQSFCFVLCGASLEPWYIWAVRALPVFLECLWMFPPTLWLLLTSYYLYLESSLVLFFPISSDVFLWVFWFSLWLSFSCHLGVLFIIGTLICCGYMVYSTRLLFTHLVILGLSVGLCCYGMKFSLLLSHAVLLFSPWVVPIVRVFLPLFPCSGDTLCELLSFSSQSYLIVAVLAFLRLKGPWASALGLVCLWPCLSLDWRILFSLISHFGILYSFWAHATFLVL